MNAISGKTEEDGSAGLFTRKESKAKAKVQVVTDSDINASLRSDIVGLGKTLTESLLHKAVAEENTNRNKSSGRSDISISVEGSIDKKLW